MELSEVFDALRMCQIDRLGEFTKFEFCVEAESKKFQMFAFRVYNVWEDGGHLTEFRFGDESPYAIGLKHNQIPTFATVLYAAACHKLQDFRMEMCAEQLSWIPVNVWSNCCATEENMLPEINVSFTM
jgi:hypothetical protein